MSDIGPKMADSSQCSVSDSSKAWSVPPGTVHLGPLLGILVVYLTRLLPVQTLAVHFHSTSQHQHCLTSAFNSLFQQTIHSLHFGKAISQFQQLESPLRSRCCMGFEPPWLTPRGGTLTREVVEGERMEATMSS